MVGAPPIVVKGIVVMRFMPFGNMKWRGQEVLVDADGFFELFDLRVEVVAPAGARLWCGSRPGDYFEVHGEMLHFRPDMPFSLYSLAAILPLLPAKQRPTEPADWMTTDAEVACPDPNCPS